MTAVTLFLFHDARNFFYKIRARIPWSTSMEMTMRTPTRGALKFILPGVWAVFRESLLFCFFMCCDQIRICTGIHTHRSPFLPSKSTHFAQLYRCLGNKSHGITLATGTALFLQSELVGFFPIGMWCLVSDRIVWV